MKEDKIHLNNSELKIMDILWEKGALPAKEVTLLAAQRYSWNKNTTYTILKSLVEKQYLQRQEPNFLCQPLLSLQQVQKSEAKGVLDKLYKGSVSMFFSALAEDEPIDPRELRRLQELIHKMQ